MKKILKSIIFASLLLIGITTSCNLPSSLPPTATPMPSPVNTATPLPTPTEFIPPASATPILAPLCEADSASVSTPVQCQSLIAEEGGTFCTRKKPYNLIFLNKGAVYEVLTRGFTCSNNGMKNGRQIVTCTGKMAAQFEVNVCDPSCIIPTVQAESMLCPSGYNFNNFQGCCTLGFQSTQQNCVVLKMKTTTCAVDCSVYNKKACNKNSIACIWSDKTATCVLRK